MIQYDDTTLRSFTRIAAAGTFIRFFQTIFENTSLWRLKCLVTLSTYRRYINKYIYLSIYYTIDTLTKYQAKQNHSIMPLAAYIETRLVVSQQYLETARFQRAGGFGGHTYR